MNPTLLEYGDILRRRWRWLLWGGLGALLASAVLLSVRPPLFRCDARVFVRTPGDISRVVDGGEDYAQKQAETYAALARGNGLAERVAADLGLDIAPAVLSGRISAAHLPGTALVEVSVRAPSATEARRTAEVLLNELTATVRSLESIPGALVPRAELVVVDPPGRPVRTTIWGARLYPGLAGAVLIGIAVGAGAAVAESVVRERA